MLCDNSFSSGDNSPSVQSKMCSQKEESLRKGWIRRRAVYVIFCGFIGLREKNPFLLGSYFLLFFTFCAFIERWANSTLFSEFSGVWKGSGEALNAQCIHTLGIGFFQVANKRWFIINSCKGRGWGCNVRHTVIVKDFFCCFFVDWGANITQKMLERKEIIPFNFCHCIYFDSLGLYGGKL